MNRLEDEHAVATTRRSSEITVSVVLTGARITHEIVAMHGYARTATEAAEGLGVPVSSIVKSLVCVVDGSPVVALVPGDRDLSFAKLAALAGAREARLASRRLVEKASGYPVGGVAPVGLPPAIPVFGDSVILSTAIVFCGAGSDRHMLRIASRDLERHVPITWGEICA